jgi:hypothetical protein
MTKLSSKKDVPTAQSSHTLWGLGRVFLGKWGVFILADGSKGYGRGRGSGHDATMTD